MKRSTSLRKKIFTLMALLVVLQSLALLFALNLSNVFTALDSESFRLFGGTAEERVGTLNRNLSGLIGATTTETETLTANLDVLRRSYDEPLTALTGNDEFYAAAADVASASVLNILDTNFITGAFVVFNGSNANKTIGDAHSAIYIRNSAPNTTSALYLLEVGPISIAQKNKLSTGINWSLDMRFASDNSNGSFFYTQPIEASQTYPRSEIQRYGYWAQPFAALPDKQNVICYTLPLLDIEGKAYGVLGIELSLSFFTPNYLPATELPYENSFYAITATSENDSIDLEWFIPSNPIAQIHLQGNKTLPLLNPKDNSLYSTFVNGVGEMYCAPIQIEMYSRNSPFYETSWSLLALVPKDILHESSRNVRNILIGSILITTIVAFGAISILTYFSTREISALSAHVKQLAPKQDIHFTRTGLQEIDELCTALEILNKSVLNSAAVTAKIMDLTPIPMGCYEITSKSPYVMVTEYIYSLLLIESGLSITQSKWREHHAKLTAEPATGYEDVYRFSPDETSEPIWLRVVESTTDTGEVGLVLDVTQEIEENMRLAHELDYDSLTRLYNRSAFKREVYSRIKQDPHKIGALIFIDLDNLKYINDTFGHEAGDHLLVRAGEMFERYANYGAVISRISGDEFAIYLHGYSSKEEIRKIIKNERSATKDFYLITPDNLRHKIRSSAGLAWYPDDSDNVADLLKLSDFAMYEVKHQKKGDIFEFSRESYTKKSFLLDNRESINQILDDELITFVFQPIISLRTGQLFAYEALMRPTGGNYQSPTDILAVASSQSKLGRLENLVMQKMFDFVLHNLDKIGNAQIFINSIPSQRITIDDYDAFMVRYKPAFEKIVIELTEADSLDTIALSEKIIEVRKMGLKIALDDFGSGHSNELRILSLSPDIIKIDMGIVQGVCTSLDKQALIANLVSFCHTRNILTIAEGVEDAFDLAALIELDVDFVQGNFLAEPSSKIAPLPLRVKKTIQQLQVNEGKSAINQ